VVRFYSSRLCRLANPLSVLGLTVWGEVSLGSSILFAVIYFFFSAKWVKLALVGKADFFWIPLHKGVVEVVLDLSYFLMMVGFLVGVFFIVRFMTTHVLGGWGARLISVRMACFERNPVCSGLGPTQLQRRRFAFWW